MITIVIKRIAMAMSINIQFTNIMTQIWFKTMNIPIMVQDMDKTIALVITIITVFHLTDPITQIKTVISQE